MTGETLDYNVSPCQFMGFEMRFLESYQDQDPSLIILFVIQNEGLFIDWNYSYLLCTQHGYNEQCEPYLWSDCQ